MSWAEVLGSLFWILAIGTTDHYRVFPLPIGTLTAVGRTADLVARITVAVVFAETAFDSIGDFVSTEPIDTSVAPLCLRCYPGRRGCVASEAPPLRMDRPPTAAGSSLRCWHRRFPSPVRDFPMQRRSPSSARCPGSVAWRSVAFSVSKALEFPPASLTDRPGYSQQNTCLSRWSNGSIKGGCAPEL